MANKPQDSQQLVDVLTTGQASGIDVNTLDKTGGPTWLQNVFARAGRYETRGGFGTLAQFGTTLISGRVPNGAQAYGYGPPLGAYLMITNQGHTQIISVHELNAFTGVYEGQNIQNLIALSVYDITTGRRAEHVVRRQTQWTTNLPNVQLQSFTNPQWVQVPVPTAPSFAQLGDLLYICMPGRGVYFYRPVDPVLVDQRLQSVPGLTPNGDSAWVELLQPSDGAFVGAGDVYFNPTTFPVPTSCCTYLNRLVYASGRKLYFSDVDRPDNILANSFFQIPTELPITAVTSVKGVILAFTAEETWLYQPNSPDQTGLISGGNVYNLSRSIGCLGPNAIVQMANVAVFMDQRGIYSTDGGMAVTKMSDAIDPWFSLPDQIQNPFTAYVAGQGRNNYTNQQPRAFIDFTGQLSAATMTWDSQNQFLYITLQDMALVYGPRTGWSVLLFETMAVPVDGLNPRVGVQQRIVHPIILTHGGLTYLIGGDEEENYDGVRDKSVYILQMGRGGSLDRSSVAQEDLRNPSQPWTRYHNGGVEADQANLWVAPPIPLPAGYVSPSNTLTDAYLIPIYAANSRFQLEVQQITLKLRFDKFSWEPVLVGAGPGFDYILPGERLASAAGWITTQITQAGAPNPAGDTFSLRWYGGAAAPASWSAWPDMVLTRGAPQPLIYLLMKRRAGTEANTVLGMGFQVFPGDAKMILTGSNQDVNGYFADQSLTYPEQNLGDNTHAQPVDWALATRSVGDGKAQYKARGTYATIQSYGKAAVQQVPAWYYGPYGTTTASDYKDFSTQQLDISTLDPTFIPDKAGVRDRIEVTGQLAPTTKTGNNVARWGDTTDQTAGNMLVDDAAVDTIATSEGVRGEYFRTLLAGCLNANGEQVKVQAVKVLLRNCGGVRRTGRRGQT